jgi:hypothetical protein
MSSAQVWAEKFCQNYFRSDCLASPEGVYQINLIDVQSSSTDAKVCNFFSLQSDGYDIITLFNLFPHIRHIDYCLPVLSKCRELIVQPRSVRSSGLLILFERGELFPLSGKPSGAQDWKRMIQQCGLRLLKYRTVEYGGRQVSAIILTITSPDQPPPSTLQSTPLDPLLSFDVFIRAYSREYNAEMFHVDRRPLPSLPARPPPPNHIPKDNKTSLPVAIVGGGLGGTALALALQRKGMCLRARSSSQ